LKILLTFLIIGGLLYLAVFQLKQLFFSTSYFEIKKIEVAGLNKLQRDEVVKLAGVSPNMNIFVLEKDSIKSRLLLNPSIQTAKVELEGLYTLKISIRERTSLLYIKSGRNFFEVSEDGVILGSDISTKKDLPIITGIELEDKRIGDSVNKLDEFLAAKNWIIALDPDILKNISEINLANLQNPYLFLVSGEKIIPRNLEDFRNRYFFLNALLDNLKKNKVEPDYIDFRAPNEIVIKPKKIKRPVVGGNCGVADG